jgi:hypothetical protein
MTDFPTVGLIFETVMQFNKDCLNVNYLYNRVSLISIKYN